MTDETALQPSWRLVYEHIKTLQVDDVVTYETLTGMLGYEFTENRAAFYRALQELEAHNMHTMINVANVGYRVAEAREHEKVARSRHKAGAKKIRRSVSAIKSADRSQLTPEERERFDRLEETAQRHADMLRRLNGKVERVAKDVKDTRRQTKGDLASMQTQVDRLREAMERQGIEVPVVGVDD